MMIFDLKTEYLTEPLGIGNPNPVFSWKMKGEGVLQSEYRVAVASDPSLLDAPDLWDSETVPSSESVGIAYRGRSLADKTRYFWRVTVNGTPSPVASFETAFLKDAMPGSHWIGMPLANHGATDLIRYDFSVRKPVRRARLYLAALGCARVWLNGEPLSDGYFDGAISVWSKRVFYRTYALAPKMGQNALAVELGYGFYGAKKMCAQVFVEYEDGTACSVPTFPGRIWNVTKGFCVQNSVYGGEIRDGRRDRSILSPAAPVLTSEFCSAYATEAPGGVLTACPVPPMRVAERIPVKLESLGGGRYLADAGVNLTGWLRVCVKGARGARITLRYAELREDDGIATANLRTAENTDVYILGGEGEEIFSPAFTYHGFRYVEITAEAGAELLSAEAEHVRSDVNEAGTFTCSDETLVRLHEIAARTEANNLNGVFTDCPQRDERLAWLNDLSPRIFQSVCNFDLSSYLANFVDMISDSQKEDGAIGDTVPFAVGSPLADPVSAYPLLGWIAYRFYGDKGVLVRNYGGFCRWMERLGALEKDGVLDWGLYGDWCPARPYSRADSDTHSGLVTPAFMSAAYYLWNHLLMEKIASALGDGAETARWKEQTAERKKAFLTRYYDEESGLIGGGSQTACAVAMTVFPENLSLCARLSAHAAREIEREGYHMTCGNQGYRHLIYRLAEAGYADTIVRLLINREYPGWGYMIEKGATTVWERWEADVRSDMHSFNHPMFGSYDGFFYHYLAGIRMGDAPAFREIVVEPCFVRSLDRVSASVETVRGTVSVSWERAGKTVVLRVATPANTLLTVRANGAIKWNGQVRQGEMKLTNGTFTFIIEETV